MNKIKKVFSGSYSFKFILGYVLMKLQLSKYFTIPQNGFFLKFYPTALSWTLWVAPKSRDEELNFIGKYVNEGDTVLDIGANIGQISLFMSKRVNSNGTVMGFEPHPKTFKYLEKNVSNNSCENITLFQNALGAKNGEIYFSNKFSDDQNIINENSTENTIKVKVERLDSITSNINFINFLKIDVEGYELFVFKGGIETLKKTKYIFFESWEEHFKNFNYTTTELLAFLHLNQFETYRINKAGGIESIDKNYSSVECENLFAINKLF